MFKNRITKTVNIAWEDRHSLQKQLYEMVTKYVSEGYNRARKEKKELHWVSNGTDAAACN
ncbi:hypothetical protein [Syntrophaceticus schinkii]|uniref:hypothetical protein n=1 Tax=Syntrophaceticus schinkii TaxID=499207 RepID=UPI001E2FD4CA|nr:hypothetical protein [Syntrophaceticus schinkii]